MNNLEYHIRVACYWCGWLNHLTVEILGSNKSVQHRCGNCDKFFIELHSKEIDEEV